MVFKYVIQTLTFFIYLSISVSTGCTQRHFITIDPYVSVAPYNLNPNLPKAIGLKVVNLLSSNNIAHRSDPDLSFYSPRYIVRPKSDLADIIKKKSVQGCLQ